MKPSHISKLLFHPDPDVRFYAIRHTKLLMESSPSEITATLLLEMHKRGEEIAALEDEVQRIREDLGQAMELIGALTTRDPARQNEDGNDECAYCDAVAYPPRMHIPHVETCPFLRAEGFSYTSAY